MDEKKDYTATQEQLARFAKALGHPARIAIMHFLAKQKTHPNEAEGKKPQR